MSASNAGKCEGAASAFSAASRPVTGGRHFLCFVFAGLLCLVAATPGLPATINDVSLETIAWNSFASEYGQVDVDVTLAPTDTGVFYLNVLADLDASGTFADYSVSAGTQTEWVTRNVPLFPGPGENLLQGNTFPLIDPTAATIIDLNVRVTSTPLTSQPVTGGQSFTSKTVQAGSRITTGAGKEGSIAGVAPDPAAGTGGFNDVFQSLLHLAGIKDIKGNIGVPDIAQTDSECAPTSAANSLRWLATENGFNDKLPASNAQLIQDLKTKMNTTPASGTTDSDMVNGKIAYINEKGLPLTVKFRDGNSVINGQAKNKPDKDFIWGELADDEDIELGFTFTGAGGGGHWVTLVGGIHFLDGSLGVWIHDPDDKNKAKPNTQYFDLKLRDDGFLEMAGYGLGHFIDIVVSESPTPEPATATLAGAALLWIVAARRRRRRRKI